ncbi:lipopolysaccharide biosynthesis protein [Halobacillus yeomjeoni]|uniref:Oligosaccharide flippase family protein n=1 Tax=Halobacillus yeomjeoni TaxID=311194 RepID=A0A931HW43_9BACI|nr:oligosaccharide flippase family protein [Halobacillus yeomjeoni]MBH0230752.1 oligosaccharide flippase family protein [Halobacillus yeomjeoni]
MNKGASRTINSLRNSWFAIVGQGINIILQFLLRTVFIMTLGIEYLGVNGLFTNILTVLALTELGIGTAIVISLYKPLAENNINKINALMNWFKKIYAAIGTFIFLIGITLIPFLDYLIKDSPDVGNLNVIYILFLIDSSVTYFFAHYRSLLNADQKGYIDSLNKIVFSFIQILLQIVILLVLGNFYMYLIIRIIIHILSGYVISLKAKKIYPYLNNKGRSRLDPNEIKGLVRNALAMFSHKMGFVVLNSTDSIIISSFIGTVAVGLYSNYYLLISTVGTLLSLVVAAIQASVGNLYATSDEKKIYNIFLKINFMYAWIYGYCAICLYVLVSPFITVWIGRDYLMDISIVAIIVLNFYLQGMRQSVLVFTTANGLFYNMRFKPIFEVAINLVVSLVLVQSLGMVGVFLGTLISTILTSFWYEPYTLYSKGFKKSTMNYFIKYFWYTLVVVITAVITKYLSDLIANESILDFLIKMGIVIILPNFIFIVVFFRSKEFKSVYTTIRSLIYRKLFG